jgi:hypothetical protein
LPAEAGLELVELSLARILLKGGRPTLLTSGQAAQAKHLTGGWLAPDGLKAFNHVFARDTNSG